MGTNSTKTRTINISLPEQLVEIIDNAAKGEFATRSDFIRESIVQKLRSREDWELLVDFTKIDKQGVDIDELLKRL